MADTYVRAALSIGEDDVANPRFWIGQGVPCVLQFFDRAGTLTDAVTGVRLVLRRVGSDTPLVLAGADLTKTGVGTYVAAPVPMPAGAWYARADCAEVSPDRYAADELSFTVLASNTLSSAPANAPLLLPGGVPAAVPGVQGALITSLAPMGELTGNETLVGVQDDAARSVTVGAVGDYALAAVVEGVAGPVEEVRANSLAVAEARAQIDALLAGFDFDGGDLLGLSESLAEAMAAQAALAARVNDGLAGEDLSAAIAAAPGASVVRPLSDHLADLRRSVLDFGVKGDVRTVEGACTIAADSNVLTVAGAAFTQADVGKGLILPDAAAYDQGVALVGTIQAVGSPTQVTLSVPAGLAVNNGSVALRYGAMASSSVACSVRGYSRDLTVSAPIFSAADRGKLIFIPGAGIYQSTLVTTISSVTSPTRIRLGTVAQYTLEAATRTIQWGAGVIKGVKATIAKDSAALTIDVATFTADDVGKAISLTSGGLVRQPIKLPATIASVQSATQVTLSATAVFALTGQVKKVRYGTDDTAAFNTAVNGFYPMSVPDRGEGGGYMVLGEIVLSQGRMDVRGVGKAVIYATRQATFFRLATAGALAAGLIFSPVGRNNSYQVQVDAAAADARLEAIEIREGNSGIKNFGPRAIIKTITLSEMLGGGISHDGPQTAGSVVEAVRFRNFSGGGVSHTNGATRCLLIDAKKYNDPALMTPIQYQQWIQWDQHLGGDIVLGTRGCSHNRAYLVYNDNARDGNITWSGDDNEVVGALTSGSLSSGVGLGGSRNRISNVWSIGNKIDFYVTPSAGGLCKDNVFTNCHGINAKQFGLQTLSGAGRAWVAGRTYSQGSRFCSRQDAATGMWGVFKLADAGLAYTYGNTPPKVAQDVTSFDGVQNWTCVAVDPVTLDPSMTFIGCSIRGAGIADWVQRGTGSVTRIGCADTQGPIDEAPRWQGAMTIVPPDLDTYVYHAPNSRHATHRGVRGVQAMANLSTRGKGSEQKTETHFHALTRLAEPTVLTPDLRAYGAGNSLVLPDRSAFAQTWRFFAHDFFTSDTKMWSASLVAQRGVGPATLSLGGVSIVEEYATAGAAAWTVALVPSLTLGAPLPVGTGQDGREIRWFAICDAMELTEPPAGMNTGTGRLIEYSRTGPDLIFRRSTRGYDTRRGRLEAFDVDQARFSPLLIEESRTGASRNPAGEGGATGLPGTLPTKWAAPTLPTGVQRQVTRYEKFGDAYLVEFRLWGTPTSIPAASEIRWEPNTQCPVAALGEVWTDSVHLQLLTDNGSSAANLGISHILDERQADGGAAAGVAFTSVPVVLAPTDTDVPDRGLSLLPESRIEVTRTLVNATVGRVNAGLRFTWTLNAPVDATLRLWIPQTEKGEGATSVILPPAGTQVATTRGLDLGRASALTLFPLGAGTVRFRILLRRLFTLSRPIFQTDAGTDADRLRCRVMSTGAIVAGVVIGAVSTDLASPGTLAVGEEISGVLAFDTTGVSVLLDGGSVVTGALAMPTGATLLRTGSDVAGKALNGEMRFFDAVAGRAADADLQGLIDAMPVNEEPPPDEEEEPPEEEEEEEEP